MIVSFGDRATEDLYHNRPTSRARRFPQDVIGPALVKMDILNGSAALRDLRSQPGNRLEVLKGDLKGYHSIRVNDQWRLIFRWKDSNVHEVRFIDYHR
ncbi:MAG: type II toxin-antitoxin system RelE/ParE family toxin [Deltaproteobacteria bacterium]|nr:type II toxin-antitoxin system RelE/ParE family toxin [Deltaproteobacteria bacterium]